jgi:RNA polymerase sigma factor (sigma-70 family)
MLSADPDTGEVGIHTGEDFEEFFRREYPRFVRSLYLLTGHLDEAEDLAQEALARTFGMWSTVQGMESPAGYAYRIALNLNRNRIRHLRVRARRLLMDARTVASTAPGNLQGEISAAVARLPRSQREAFVLVDWLGMDTEEAGRVLGIKAVSVRSRVHRARASLREQLGGPHE